MIRGLYFYENFNMAMLPYPKIYINAKAKLLSIVDTALSF